MHTVYKYYIYIYTIYTCIYMYIYMCVYIYIYIYKTEVKDIGKHCTNGSNINLDNVNNVYGESSYKMFMVL